MASAGVSPASDVMARVEYRGVAGVGQGLGHRGVLLVKEIGEKKMMSRGSAVQAREEGRGGRIELMVPCTKIPSKQVKYTSNA